MQDKILDFINKIDDYFNKIRHADVDTEKQILYRSMKLTEEVGEFNQELFTYLWKAKQIKLDNFKKENLENEFADVVFSAYLVAKSCDINIQEALERKMKIVKEWFGME